MVAELWFYATTVLICTGYALLMQSHPQWKLYLTLGLAAFVIAGAVLVYWDVKKKEDIQSKLSQQERELEVAKQEAEKQQALTRDATDRAHLLAEQLQVKSEELSKVLHDKPHIDGAITKVRVFPWQHATASNEPVEGKTTAAGVLIFAHLENEGSTTSLANWELTIELPDHTIIRPQKWPVKKSLRIPCEDGPIKIPRDEYLDAKTTQAIQTSATFSGVTVWMVKSTPLSTIQHNQSSYTLTARDNTGVVHALKPFNLSPSQHRCFGFDVLD
jgi:low affinity Fe/Cu permease